MIAAAAVLTVRTEQSHRRTLIIIKELRKSLPL